MLESSRVMHMARKIPLEQCFEQWWETIGTTYGDGILKYCFIKKAEATCIKDLKMATRDAFFSACGFRDEAMGKALDRWLKTNPKAKTAIKKELGLDQTPQSR